ncbi:MAG TPA: prepilin peptidase [Caulobacteraceae bacterium]|nr:prepilin peptidase [Caulobacteraceae bacterium]
MSPELIRSLALTVFAGLVMLAAVTDLASFTIPNWISAALALAFAPAALAAGDSLGAIGLSFAIGLGMLVVAAGMFALGWLGGGDAKLMTAAALWLGLKGLAPFVIFTGLAGGALALALLGLRSAWVRPYTRAAPAWARRLATPGESAPYGVAIAAGALAAFAVHPLV